MTLIFISKRRRHWVREEMRIDTEIGATWLLALKLDGGVTHQRTWEELEAKKDIEVYQICHEEHSTDLLTLVLAQWDPCKMINMCCCKPLSMWWHAIKSQCTVKMISCIFHVSLLSQMLQGSLIYLELKQKSSQGPTSSPHKGLCELISSPSPIYFLLSPSLLFLEHSRQALACTPQNFFLLEMLLSELHILLSHLFLSFCSNATSLRSALTPLLK